MIGLGLGLGLRKVGGGTAAFTPASLFTGGYSGDIFSANDLSKLFVDAAGLTPVTADGDLVGRMVGTINGTGMRQPTDTSSLKPVYKTGGYVQFDGVDDFLEAALSITGYPLTIALVFDRSFTNSGIGAAAVGVSAAEYRTLGVNATSGTVYERSTANVNSTPAISYTVGAGLQSAFGIFTTTTARVLFTEGTEGTVSHSNTHSAAATLLLGKQRSSGSFGSAKIRHAMFINRELSAPDRASLRTYWGAL